MATLTRTSHDKVIAGVCGGLAERFEVSSRLLRILFAVVTVLLSGSPLVIYIALWVIMPKR